MVKAIIFDCFGVLTADTWREFVATLPESKRQGARDLNHAYGGSYIGKPEFLRSIKELTGKLPRDIDGMLDNETTKNTEIFKLISKLKRTYKIGMLSNVASDWIKDRFLEPEEQELFDDLIFSYKVRMTKPDPRIFQLAAERLGVELEECVMVDDVDYYCEIAAQLGMKTVLYQNFPQFKADLQKVLLAG